MNIRDYSKKGVPMLKNGMICIECGNENAYELRKVTRKYEGDDYCFDLEVEVPFCTNCGAPIEDDDIEEEIIRRANQRIRQEIGIITKDEILIVLDKYNVSQKLLSRLLGWGEITLTRYISGGYTPNQANSMRLRELNNPYVFQKMLEMNIEETNGEIQKENAFNRVQQKVNVEIGKLERDEKIYQIANWFLSKSSKENPITHLGLQKLLYFSQAWYRVLCGNWLFLNECEAWVHGAVYPEIYSKFRKFKYNPLPVIKNEVKLKSDELQILEIVKKYYYDIYNAKTLEKICHSEEPYRNARLGYDAEQSSSECIHKEQIEKYYSKVAQQYHITRDNPVGIKEYLDQLLA